MLLKADIFEMIFCVQFVQSMDDKQGFTLSGFVFLYFQFEKF